MRILANYSLRTNGESYSVTFETMGDVPKDQSDATVDELFAKAKEAVARQVRPNTPEPGDNTDKIPSVPVPGIGNGGNGNNGNSPITPKQLKFLCVLVKKQEKSQDVLKSILQDYKVAGLPDLSKSQAGELIKSLRS